MISVIFLDIFTESIFIGVIIALNVLYLAATMEGSKRMIDKIIIALGSLNNGFTFPLS